MKRKRCLMVVSTVAVVHFLCPIRDVRAEPEILKPEEVRQMIDQTKRSFRFARFNKPADANSESMEYRFAPLIVEELEGMPSTSHSSRFDNLHTPKIGSFRPTIAPDIPVRPDTVYFFSDMVKINDQKIDQIDFLWWYEKKHECVTGSLQSVVQMRGVRILVGTDGMPILWRALSNGTGIQPFFVAQSLESAAKAQFGDPLPGRKFSIEKKDENSDVVVARLLDDGPVPMGPYVYVDASLQRGISTMHCRCSESQFDEVVEPVISYKLEPVENLDKKWLRESAGLDLDELLKPEPLDKLFRWPKM